MTLPGTRLLLPAALACLLAATFPACASRDHAAAHASGRTRSYRVSGSEADPDGIQPGGVRCTITDAGCRAIFTGHVNYAGGMQGTAAYVLNMNPVPDSVGNHYTGSEHFDRLTLPCGTGSIDVDLEGVYETTQIDVPTHTTTLIENGTFHDGRGGLVGVTGHFTTPVYDHNDTTTDGHYVGTITCSVR